MKLNENYILTIEPYSPMPCRLIYISETSNHVALALLESQPAFNFFGNGFYDHMKFTSTEEAGRCLKAKEIMKEYPNGLFRWVRASELTVDLSKPFTLNQLIGDLHTELA